MLALSLFDIYMASGILGTGYVLLSAVLGNLHLSTGGGDVGHDLGHGGTGDLGHDAGGDAGDDFGHDAGHSDTHQTGHVVDATDERRRAFSAFSPTIVASFLAGFGVVGLVLERGYDWGQISLGVSAAGGFVFAAAIMAVFNKLALAASGSSHARLRDLIGLAAEVTTPIAENTPGQITYVLKGSRFSRSARSADGKPLARGQKVTIEAIEGNKTYVLKAD